MTDRETANREKAIKALGDLPPFSPVLDRLLGTLSNETVSISRVSDIIETDTVIAGNVLKLVNSALYGRRGTINSVRHAVSLLGINKLRNAVFAMSITRVWSQVKTAPTWSSARFNLHSVACALMCDSLAQRVPVTYPEGAFAAGLFHDLGMLLIAVGLRDEYMEIEHMRDDSGRSLMECEREVLGVTHPELSAEALAIWNLPKAIQDAVRFHHDPALDASAPAGVTALSLAVQCSDRYIDGAGMTLLARSEGDGEPEREPFEPLGIKLESADFLEEFEKELSALTGVFH